jgi:hypothetical protein
LKLVPKSRASQIRIEYSTVPWGATDSGLWPPSRVRIEVDVPDIDLAMRDSVLGKITAACDEVAGRCGVAVRTAVVNADPPAQCGPAVAETLARIAV